MNKVAGKSIDMLRHVVGDRFDSYAVGRFGHKLEISNAFATMILPGVQIRQF